MIVKYMIWSLEHRGYWKSDRCGYLTSKDKDADLSDIGFFTLKEALEICFAANTVSIEEMMVPITNFEK